MAEGGHEHSGGWELSKENIQPLRQGRNSQALQSALNTTEDMQQKEILYEESLRNTESDDPLDNWIKYIRWLEQHCLTGKEAKLRRLVQNCIKKFMTDPRYTNDTRWLYVWLKYAALSVTTGSIGIFQFMKNEGECLKLAGLYIQWAYELERVEDNIGAAEVLQDGLSVQASPIQALQTAYKELQERVARKLATDDSFHSPPEETRCFLGLLKGVGKNKTTPFDRQSAQGPAVLGLGGHQQPSVGSKEAFSVLSEEHLLSGGPHRVVGLGNKTRPPTATAIPGSVKAEKENVRNPDMWNKQKLGGRSVSGSGLSKGVAAGRKSEFVVLADGGGEHKPEERRHTMSTFTGALKSRKEEFNHPLAPFTNPGAKVEVPMYRKSEVYAGNTEFSLEEIRALKYSIRTRRPSPNESGNARQNESGSVKLKLVEIPSQVSRDFQPAGETSSLSKGTESESRGGSLVKEDKEGERKRKPLSLKSSLPIIDGASKEAFVIPSDETLAAEQLAQGIMAETDSGSVPSILRTQATDPQEVSVSKPSSSAAIVQPSHVQPMDENTVAQKPEDQKALTKKPPIPKKPVFYPPPPPVAQPILSYGGNRMGSGPSSRESSFTINVRRETMAVLSDTLHFSQYQPLPSEEEEPTLPTPVPPPAVIRDDFQIFDENENGPKPSADNFQVFSDADVIQPGHQDTDIDKENRIPDAAKLVRNEGKGKRGLVEVLRNAKGIVTEPYEIEEPMDTASQVNLEEAPAIKPPTRPTPGKYRAEFPEDVTMFDPNEPTIAKFEVVSASQRIASTPCHGLGSIPPPCFSGIKPWEQRPVESHHFQQEEEPIQQEDIIIPPPVIPSKPDPEVPSNIDTQKENEILAETHCQLPKTPCLDANPTSFRQNRNLSTIQELSRETLRSGSSSISSASSTSDASTRRKALTSTATTPLLPIKEQLSFGGSMSTGFSSMNNMPVTPFLPYSQVSGQEKQQPTSPADDAAIAVRRLSLGDTRVERHAGDDTDDQVEKTGFGMRTNITEGVDPWDEGLIAQIIFNLPRPLSTSTNFHDFPSAIPPVKIGGRVTFGGDTFHVHLLLGEGAFARAYKISNVEDDNVWVLKVQKPGCPWEYYICEEVKRRLTKRGLDKDILPGLMEVRDMFQYYDGTFLLNEFHPRGTLLDMVNKMQTGGKTKEGVGESACMSIMVEILKIMEAVHSAKIIHADVKPDNFLMLEWPSLESIECPRDVLNGPISLIKLIDWGRAIDMGSLPDNVTFKGTAQTSGFQCPEMLEGRPWTYQTDLFGILGTCHVLLFGSYMKVYKLPSGQWKNNTTFKRKWNVEFWKCFFSDLLNVPDCNSFPDLSLHRAQMEEFLMNADSREWHKQMSLINSALHS